MQSGHHVGASLLPEGQDLLDTFWVRRVHVLCLLLLLYPGGGGQQCMRVILFCEKAKSFQSSTEVLRFLKKIRPTLVFVTVKDQHHFSTAAAETDNSSSPILVIEQLNRTLSSVFCSLSETWLDLIKRKKVVADFCLYLFVSDLVPEKKAFENSSWYLSVWKLLKIEIKVSFDHRRPRN